MPSPLFPTGDRQRGGEFATFSAGGGQANPWTPAFSSATGTLEVHFFDQTRQEIFSATYTLSATLTGVYGLTRTGSSFVQDLSGPAKGAMGFIAFARTAAVNLSAGGLSDKPGQGNQLNNFVRSGATTPWILPVGWQLWWGILADSHGWSIVPETSSGVADTVVAPLSSSWTDHSGTITSGGTAQTGAAADPARTALFIQNPPSSSESLFFNFTTAAVTTGQPSIELAPGDIYCEEGTTITPELISVIAATTGHAFVLKTR